MRLEVFYQLVTLVCLVGAGMLIRQVLEAWKDYHVQKALHEQWVRDQKRSEERHVRFRRADRRQEKQSGIRQLPARVLQDIMHDLHDHGQAKVCCIGGRWKRGKAA